MSMKTPIFPLNLVIFPGSEYPLHIFEERYKKMINRCLSNNEKFGIVAKIDTEILKIGCYVKIAEITKRYANGRMDIVIHGIERFFLLSKTMHNDGYFVGETQTFADSGIIDFDNDVFEKTKKLLNKIIGKVNIDLGTNFWNNLNETNYKSFKIAEKAGLNIRQQQNLLSIQSESERLNFLYGHLLKVGEYIDKNLTVKNIIAGDGYLN